VSRRGFDALLVGHFAVDRIVSGGDAWVASGGGVYYGSMALARLGYRVAVATRVCEADFPRLEEMRAEGIAVFATKAAQTSGMENTYPTADQDKRHCVPLGFAGPFRSGDIPSLWAKVILVVPILAGEIDLSLLSQLATRAPIALDAQGFVRFAEGKDVVFRDWPEKEAGLALVRTLKVDDTEAEVLTGLDDPRAAAAALAAYGPREVVLTRRDGVLIYADGAFHEAPFTPRRLVGRTGRGDTCFASYVARRFSASPGEAAGYAAAVTSLKMEAHGPFAGTGETVLSHLEGT
jgi:sugar/nucleoside kinase (ribokinase family)